MHVLSFYHVTIILYFCGAVSSYEPDSSLSVGSLSALEHAGIRIVIPLKEHLAELQSVTGIGQDSSLMLIDRWGKGEGRSPLTWRSLLDTLQELNLGDLSQQIGEYLSGK